MRLSRPHPCTQRLIDNFILSMRTSRTFLFSLVINNSNNKRRLSHYVTDRIYKTDTPSQPVETTSNHVTVGITEFIGDHPKVRANFRERNTDFKVNEIDPNGKIVKLTDLNPPTTKPKSNAPFYTHCTLSKEGMAMNTFVKLMTSRLGIKSSDVAWAEHKDKNAKTCQRISIYDVPAHRLLSVSSGIRYMRLGNFSYESRPIGTAELKGNRFKVLLRDVQMQNFASSVTGAIELAVKSWKEFGFVNYFGLQRFGELEVPSFETGRAVLQMNWEKVFDLMLRPRPHDVDHMREAKALWTSTRDPVKIVQIIPRLQSDGSEEASLFLGLARFYAGGSGDLFKAFQAVPQRHRMLTINSFQFYLWNHVASFRLKNFGLKPIAGDMVKLDNANDDDGTRNGDNPDELEDDDGQRKVEKFVNGVKFKILTDNDLNNYSIYDVLLPIPGLLMPRYPNPLVQDFYEKFLKENDLGTDPFSTFSSIDEAVKGDVRHLVVKPKNVVCKYSYYDDREDIDMDTFMVSSTARMNYNYRRDTRKNKICAQLQFSLIPSSYATMALREIVDFTVDDTWSDTD